MNPINYNDPYLKSNGDITTIGAVAGGGGSSELPDYDIADAGKVLTVGDDGELEWHENGAGGGEIILDDFNIYDRGSGSHEYTKTVTITEPGNYYCLFGGYCSTLTFKVNNETIPNSFNDDPAFIHFYHNSELALSTNDVLSITITSSGKTAIFANITRI